jgi:biopolymer transport protein TolR
MHKIRKFSVRPQGIPKSDINVTPLVDVVLVLLIIFMVVTPLLDKILRVRVPDAEQEADEPHPDVTQLVVSVDADGQIAINREAIPDDQYVAKLRRVVAAKAPGDRLVFFTADDKAKYPRVVVALDGARRAGAEILTMTTEPMAVPSSTAQNTAIPTTVH